MTLIPSKKLCRENSTVTPAIRRNYVVWMTRVPRPLYAHPKPGHQSRMEIGGEDRRPGHKYPWMCPHPAHVRSRTGAWCSRGCVFHYINFIRSCAMLLHLTAFILSGCLATVKKKHWRPWLNGTTAKTVCSLWLRAKHTILLTWSALSALHDVQLRSQHWYKVHERCKDVRQLSLKVICTTNRVKLSLCPLLWHTHAI